MSPPQNPFPEGSEAERQMLEAQEPDDDSGGDVCHHGVGFDERCADCEAEMGFDE